MRSASVTIDSGPISANDPLRRVPKEKWHDLMLARRQFMEIHLTYDCRCLLEFVADAELMYQALGFADVESMIREGYQLVPEEIDIAIEWLRLNAPEEPVPIAVTLGKHGGKRDQVDIIKLRHKGGTDPSYLLARLQRDHPEIRAGYNRGEFKSVRAAAIQAGIVKVKSPLEQLESWWVKATPEEREIFRKKDNAY